MEKARFTVLCTMICISIPALPEQAASCCFNRTAAQSAAAQVRRDSLEAIVELIAIDPATGQPRTRFALREYELGIVADTLCARLSAYTGNPVERIPFQIVDPSYAPDSTFTAENLVAITAGNGSAGGFMLVTAHYDAIGVRSTDLDWRENWRTLPAPGADDNATGVACVLEAARILSQTVLPFDVMFVLFSGEELGMLGSEDFAARFGGLYGEPLLGVVNLDMLGYRAHAHPGGSLNINYFSGFLSDLLVDAAAFVEPTLRFTVFYPGLGNSDHASFWELRYPAISIYEPFSDTKDVLYQFYHTVEDLPERVDFDQVERILRAVVGFVAGFEEEGDRVEVALLPGDASFFRNGNPTTREVFEFTDTLEVRCQPRRIFGTAAPAGAEMDLVVTLENAGGLRTLYTGTFGIPDLLHAEVVEVPVEFEAGDIGENIVRARLLVTGFEDDPGNNRTELRFGLRGTAAVVLDHSFRPNPVRRSFNETSFCLNLTDEGNFILELLNLEGELIDTAFIGPGYGVPLQAGLNCLNCGAIFPGVDDLASGIYLYRLKPYDVSSGGVQTGKFAVSH